MPDRRHLTFVAISCAGVLAATAFAWQYGHRGPADSALTPALAHGSLPILYRYTGLDSNFGRLAYLQEGDSPGMRFVERLSCEVVHATAGSGICLTADRGVLTTYGAQLFDASTFEVQTTLPLAGIPSRTRVSPDGRYAALTVFVTGHSYASVDFSTQTLLLDLRKREVLADLEQFKVSRNGEPFTSADFNFWGVTFTPDARTLYATLSTNRRHYLIEGDVAARTARVLHENVECPSLSPDATRIAYKKRLMDGARVVWQLQVLDLRTMQETPLAERRSVDDQLEWLDEENVLYTVPEATDGATPSTNVWRAAADGRSPPVMFLPRAYSPAVLRDRFALTAKD